SVETPAAASPRSHVHRHGRTYTWAELMKRVWASDVLECPRCLGRMRMLAAIHPLDTTRKILECRPAISGTTARACRHLRIRLVLKLSVRHWGICVSRHARILL